MEREPIYQAIYDAMAATRPTTVSRKLKHWNDVPASQQPAVLMHEQYEEAIQGKGLPVQWKGYVEIYLYTNTGGDADAIPAIEMNIWLDKIEAVFRPLAGRVNTLGGVVQHCWIEGQIQRFEAILDNQSVAIVPLYFLFV